MKGLDETRITYQFVPAIINNNYYDYFFAAFNPLPFDLFLVSHDLPHSMNHHS